MFSTQLIKKEDKKKNVNGKKEIKYQKVIIINYKSPIICEKSIIAILG